MLKFDREKFKRIRNSLKVTQKDLGQHIGYSPKTIQSWESGYSEPNATAIMQCALYMHTDIKEFFSRDPGKKHEKTKIPLFAERKRLPGQDSDMP